ncbi:MAG: DUF3035 domain-containing protein [Rhodospirillaceae bacterium]
MTARKTLLLALLLTFSLTGCEALKRAATGEKRAPDEFAVYKRPPLSLPPEYGLRPPEPGRDQPEVNTPRDQARAAILGKTPGRKVQVKPLGNETPGLLALMERTGANAADPTIRATVNRETLSLSEEDKALIDKLIFWNADAQYPGVVVNPKEEQRRLLETQALGKPINEGKVPEIRRQTPRKGILPF